MRCLLFLTLTLLFFSAWADSVKSHLSPGRWSFFHQLNSDFLEVVEEGSPYFDEALGDYPWLAKVVQLDFFKWDPSGASRRFRPACDPSLWQQASLQKPVSQEEWTTHLEKFLQDCDQDWETGQRGLLSNTIGIMSLKLHPSRYPYGRHVILKLPHQIRIKGLLAMKTDGKRRPLVIFRTGIFSNTQEFYPERYLFLQMFEQSPFDVLVLESSSGSEFLKHNTDYAVGGFDEGLQNYWIARQLQSPQEPISRLISDVHMMGMSMGGHGVLFSALLNEQTKKPVFQSALAFCPLLNMQETLDYHRSQGFSMDILNYYASRRLKVLRERIPELQEDQFIPRFFDWIRAHYQGPLIAEGGHLPGIHLPEGMQKVLEDPHRPEDLFWRLNHFWPWYENVKTPVVIFSTRKDPIVSWFLNAGRIEDHRMQFRDSNLKLFSFSQGYHCSLPVAYDWGVLATLFQTYFMRMSPSLNLQTKIQKIPLPEKVLSQLKGREVYLDLQFEVPEKAAQLQAAVRFDFQFAPSWLQRFLAPEMQVSLPLSEMEFPIDETVQSPDEASLLRRWAYQNVKAQIEGTDLVFHWQVSR